MCIRDSLNVDDHEVARYARTRILTSAGFTVHEASTGAETIEAVARYKPDLVLLDVHLPDINGMEVCRILKGKMCIRDRLRTWKPCSTAGTLHKQAWESD